jgi:hypothetical protein
VTAAGAALIFAERHVAHPVQLLLDAPVGADGAGEARRVERETAEVVATLGGWTWTLSSRTASTTLRKPCHGARSANQAKRSLCQ